jgi:glycosyltransferase XagB
MRVYDLRENPPPPLEQPPELSAERLLSRSQAVVLSLLIISSLALVAARVLLHRGPGLYTDVKVVFDTIMMFTVATVIFKGIGFICSFGPGEIHVSDEEARTRPDRGWPKAVVIAPTFGEPHMIPKIVAGLRALEYPVEHLVILFAIEWKDRATLAALEAEGLEDHFAAVICPERHKPNKPGACNYALQMAADVLQIALGLGWCHEDDIVGIFDIEDRAEPLQVNRAAWAFLQSDRTVGCVQARLNFVDENGGDKLNWLGRQDRAAYDWNFALWNRGLQKIGGPFLLGGTSQWFRLKVLLYQLRGWDRHNITEDADAGVKLARLGFQVRTFNSYTDETAIRELGNWIGRDARWWTGFVRTFLVHVRHPWRLLRDLGPVGFMSFLLNLGFMTFTMVVNPLFWVLTALYGVARAEHWTGVTGYIEGLFPPAMYLIGIAAGALGNALMVYFLVASAHETGHYRGLLIVALTAPAFWALLFVAAARGVPMLFTNKWYRTGHGGGQANAGDKLPEVKPGERHLKLVS